MHYVAGDVMEIDFAGDDLIWVDEYAEAHRDRVFVAALPASGLIYAQAFENERQQTFRVSWRHSSTSGASPETS